MSCTFLFRCIVGVGFTEMPFTWATVLNVTKS